MLIVLLSNLVQIAPTPVTLHNVPDVYEDMGGKGVEKLKEIEMRRKLILQDDDEILLLIGQFISENNSN